MKPYPKRSFSDNYANKDCRDSANQSNALLCFFRSQFDTYKIVRSVLSRLFVCCTTLSDISQLLIVMTAQLKICHNISYVHYNR
ncbi:hypothetical protein PR048_005575, partial [Dryococelus australis]